MFYSDRNIFATSQSGVFLWRMILEKSRVYCKTKPDSYSWLCIVKNADIWFVIAVRTVWVLICKVQVLQKVQNPKSRVQVLHSPKSGPGSVPSPCFTVFNFFMKTHFREKRQHMLTLWRKADAFRWDIYHFNVLHSIVCWWENYFLCQMGYT